MFNDFYLSDNEVIKILNDYNPLILKESILKHGIDEDLMQEIKIEIYKSLTKNRKKIKKFLNLQHRLKNLDFY